jgi:hypothetical protein
MRIWYGNEAEGKSRQIATLFVEVDHFTQYVIDVVKEVVERQETKNAKRIYFGAGKVDVKSFDGFDDLCDWCLARGLRVIMETSVENWSNLPKWFKHLGEVIVRFDLAYVDEFAYIKFEHGEDVYVNVKTLHDDTWQYTNLKSLNHGMFNGDILIWGDIESEGSK